MSRDPIGYEAEEWNLHEYVDGDPVSSVDPGGLRSVCGPAIMLDADDGGFAGIYIYRIVNGVRFYDVGGFRLFLRIMLCGNCDANTGKLSEVGLELNKIGTSTDIGSDWTCGTINIRPTLGAVIPVVETLENGCGCHIEKEVARYSGGTFAINASVRCSPKASMGSIFGNKKSFTWKSSWTVRIPDMTLECCPDYAPYQGER